MLGNIYARLASRLRDVVPVRTGRGKDSIEAREDGVYMFPYMKKFVVNEVDRFLSEVDIEELVDAKIGDIERWLMDCKG